METWELDAREQIRDLVARYNASGDSGRVADLLELFAPNASLIVEALREFHGHAEIRSLLTGAAKMGTGPARPTLLRHFTSTHQIDIRSQTSASGRCYFAVLTKAGLDHWGTYVDRYAIWDGRWRFAERRVRVDSSVPGSWADANLASLRERLGAETSGTELEP